MKFDINITLRLFRKAYLPFRRTLSPSRVKNSLNCGVCSVLPKICSSVNWFSFTQITPTLSSDLMKTFKKRERRI